MTEKTIDKKTLGQLAMMAAAKTSLDDDIASVSKKVAADYIEAKKTIRDYEASARKAAKAPKEEKKSKGKKQKKASLKADKKAASE